MKRQPAASALTALTVLGQDGSSPLANAEEACVTCTLAASMSGAALPGTIVRIIVVTAAVTIIVSNEQKWL
jgi:hypothetical protein